jgi:hypothetical protein
MIIEAALPGPQQSVSICKLLTPGSDFSSGLRFEICAYVCGVVDSQD